MRYLIPLLALIFILSSCEQDPEIISLDAEKLNTKTIEICHHNKGTDTWQTITVSEDKLQKYLDKGDFVGDCENTYTSFPDYGIEENLVNLGIDDEVNGYILKKNIASVKWLVLYDMVFPVLFLDGIEDFLALEILQFWDLYYIEEINLSSNMNLNGVGIFNTEYHFQGEGPSLKKLILPKSENFKEIIINDTEGGPGGGFSLLTELDFTNQINLESAHLTLTNLKELDLRKNPNINYLFLITDHVNTLDLSLNNNIETLHIYSPLNSLSLPQDSNIAYFEVGGTNINMFDFSKMAQLNYVSIGSNKNLTNVYLDNGKNRKITNVYMQNNPLLNCIQVDDAEYSTVNWTYIDSWATFSEDCGY